MPVTAQHPALSSTEETTHKVSLCFVTEIDLDRKLGGAITNDLKTINCLKKLATVDSIYLRVQKYGSAWLALPVFVSQIFSSISKSYQAFFCRGLFASFTMLLLRPLHRKKVVHNGLSVPFPSIEARYSKRNIVSRLVWFSMMRFLESVVTTNADFVVVAANNYAIQLAKSGVQSSRIQLVSFFVEDEFFQQPIKWEANERFTFCYIGGFHPYHILLPIIEGFKRLQKENPKVELCFVGDGPLRSKIENEISRAGLAGKVRFIGRLPHSLIPTFLSNVDSLIVPTTYGISTNLLEAAAAAKAIITIKRRGDMTLEHYFKQGKEILYVEETSPDDIANAMRLVSSNPEIRNAISIGARKIARRYFSEKVCLGQFQELVEKISIEN